MKAGVTLVIFTLCYFPPGFKLLHMRRSRWEQFKRTDFGGLFLFTAGLLLFTMGLSLGGNPYPWKSARVLSLIIVGACSLVVFGLWGTHYSLPCCNSEYETYAVRNSVHG